MLLINRRKKINVDGGYLWEAVSRTEEHDDDMGKETIEGSDNCGEDGIKGDDDAANWNKNSWCYTFLGVSKCHPP